MLHLRLTGFEGPLDLLLQLIEQSHLDISEVSLIQVVDQYLAGVQTLKAESAAAAADSLAEFIVIGARLMVLKSRALLPREIEPGGEGGEEEDIGRELVQMLEEYKRYRDAVQLLGTIDSSGLRAFAQRAPVGGELPAPVGLPPDVTLALLTRIVREAFAQAEKRPDPRAEVALSRDPVTVQQKITDLQERLARGERLSFRAWIAEARTRVEVIVIFLAILELYKAHAIEMRQDQTYGDIIVEPRPVSPLPAGAVTDSLDDAAT